MKKNKYIIKDLSKAILIKILKDSQNYFIAKSFKKKNSLNFKIRTVCKFSAPLQINKKNIHFVLNLFVSKTQNDIKEYISNTTNKSVILLEKSMNLGASQNVYPLLIKKSNLFFKSASVYNSFLFFFEILLNLNNFNISFFLVRYFKNTSNKNTFI